MSQDLRIRRGDTNQLTGTVKQSGAAYNLTGVTVMWFLAKTNIADADNAAVITATIANAKIEILSAAAGTIRITIAAADTSGISDTAQPLYYELQLKSTDAKIFTLQSGRLFVDADVVKAVS